ncbi:MAG: hypothetical protein ACRCW4_02645 [Candidatus Neomicrothrix subdominans]
MDLIGQEPVTELGIIAVGVEDRIRQIRLVELGHSHRLDEPRVVVLAVELEHPARHRHRHPESGTAASELPHEGVEPFPGSCTWDKYAAARRNTSFSCSNSWLRRFNSRNSAN